MQKNVAYADYIEEQDLKILKELIEIVENVESYIDYKLFSSVDDRYYDTVSESSELEQLQNN